MTSGQFELLLSKVTEANRLHMDGTVAMMRAYFQGCERETSPPDEGAGSDAAGDKATSFDPPFEPQPAIPEATGTGVAVDPVTKARLVSRYKFWMAKVREAQTGNVVMPNSDEVLGKLREIKLEAGQAGVRLELSPYDPTGTSPAGERLAAAIPVPSPAARPARPRPPRRQVPPTAQRKRKNVKR